MIVVALLWPFSNAMADEIRNLDAYAKQKAVSVSFEYAGPFDNDELREAVQSGLPTIFTFDVELSRKRENWFDKSLDSARVEIIATFNSRTREYLINYRRDRRLIRSENVAGFDALVEHMTKVLLDNLFPLPERHFSRLRIRVRGWNDHESRRWYSPGGVGTAWEIVPIRREEDR